MNLGQRIRSLRLEKKLSLGDVEKRVGLLRTYLSRVERSHSVPSIETLEKLAVAMEVPLYAFFCNGHRPNGNMPKFPRQRLWGDKPSEAREWGRLCRLLVRSNKADRALLLSTAQQLARGA